ncbi:MAG: HupE/UreJ family protein [Planctomycetes bacterium]|nr:HupE/UreJ family protein [Planctomycetota bacterium]MCB9903030.1 HupE/UreJ family protein [Planctomycetota bacterium]
MKHGPRALLATAACSSLAPTASAHLVSTELGPFYDGAAHPLVTPEDLLVILALATLAALRGAEGGRRALVGLCAAWTVATAASFAWGAPLSAPPLLVAGLLVALGLACAVNRAPSPRVLLALGIAVGVLHGLENGSAARAADGVWLSTLGIASGVFVVATLTTACGVHLERRGAAIALRVAGSWLAAIGLLFAGWQLAGPAG